MYILFMQRSLKVLTDRTNVTNRAGAACGAEELLRMMAFPQFCLSEVVAELFLERRPVLREE